MSENLGIAIVNDKVVFFSIFGLAVAALIVFFIGLAKGWWVFKNKKNGLELLKNKQEIDRDRDNRWLYIISQQASLLRKCDDDKEDIKHNCLSKQLGYVDDTFDSKETDLRIKLAGGLDRKNEKVQLAEYRFESTYHKTKREIIQIIKDNNLLASTEEELKEKIKKRAIKNTDYFRKDAPFYPIPIDEKIIDEYSEFVEKAAEDGMIHARRLAEKREEEITKLYKEYDEKINQFIQREIPNVSLNGVGSGEEKEERVG